MAESIAAQFTRLFTTALPKTSSRDNRPVKEQERDYVQLRKFVVALNSTQSLDQCIQEYLKLYERYSPAEPRSKQIFVILLERRIKLTPAGDAYPGELERDLRGGKGSPSPLNKRFHSLDQHDQAEIYQILKNMRLAGTLLDELRQAYLKAYGFNAKDFEQLYGFDPKPDEAVRKQFQAQLKECNIAWDATRNLTQKNWEKFRSAFQSCGGFVTQHGGDTLTLFQLLKWTWEPFQTRYVNGPRRRERQQTPFGVLDVEHYLRIVIALYIRGANAKQGNLRGFSDEEYRFFFEPLSGLYYEPDYKDRFSTCTTKNNIQLFYDLSIAHLQLLRIAQSKNVTLENATTKAGILSLYDTVDGLAGSTPGDHPIERRSFATDTHSRIEVAKDRFFIGDTIGVGPGKLRILYFEKEETGFPQIYIEFLSLPSVVFSIDIGNFASRVEALTFLIVAHDNRGLAELYTIFMSLLINFLVPEFGFVATFLERGIGGVLVEIGKQKAFDLALEAVSDTVAQLGPGKTLGILAAVTVLTKKGKVARLGLIKQSAARLERLERALLPRVKREFLEEAERRGGRLTTRELGDLGVHAMPDDRFTPERLINQRDTRAVDRGAGGRLTNEAARVAPFVREAQTVGRAERTAIRELTADANRQLLRDGRIPEGWSVEFPHTPSNEAGIAQTRAVGQRTVAEDREILFNVDWKTARRLGVARQVRFDGFQRFPGPRMMLREHKEVMTVWERSKFSQPRALDDLVNMMEQHGNLLQELDAAPNSWWLGVTYSGGGDALLQEVLDIALIRARQRLPEKVGKRLLSGG